MHLIGHIPVVMCGGRLLTWFPKVDLLILAIFAFWSALVMEILEVFILFNLEGLMPILQWRSWTKHHLLVETRFLEHRQKERYLDFLITHFCPLYIHTLKLICSIAWLWSFVVVVIFILFDRSNLTSILPRKLHGLLPSITPREWFYFIFYLYFTIFLFLLTFWNFLEDTVLLLHKYTLKDYLHN